MAAEYVILIVIACAFVFMGALVVRGYRNGTFQRVDAERRREWKESSRASKAWTFVGLAVLSLGAGIRIVDDPPWWMWAGLPAGLAAFGVAAVVDHRARASRAQDASGAGGAAP